MAVNDLATGAKAGTLCLMYPIGCWGNAGVLATNQKLAFSPQQCWGSQSGLRLLPAFMKYDNNIVKPIEICRICVSGPCDLALWFSFATNNNPILETGSMFYLTYTETC